jgi:hypothetical protein
MPERRVYATSASNSSDMRVEQAMHKPNAGLVESMHQFTRCHKESST